MKTKELREAIEVVELYLDQEADFLADNCDEDSVDEEREYLKAIRTVVTASKKLLNIPKITICTAKLSLHQAIYLDGHLKDSDSSLYANELSNWVGDDPVLIESVTCILPDDGVYPDLLSDLEITKETP